jgi:hypothetical protein
LNAARRVAAQAIQIVGVLVTAGDSQNPGAQDRGQRMGRHSRIAPVGDQPGDAINNADPAIGQGQQRHPAIGGDAPAIEGRADFLASYAWQNEEKTGIVIHGGRGASCVPDGVGFDTESYSRTTSYATSASPFSAPA